MLTPTHTVPTDANESGPRPAEELFRAGVGAMAGGSANERDPYPRRYE